MLTNMSIHNFALVDHMELEFHSGMTAISGETGAGKSILLDALGLTLGQRADAGFVRNDSEKADISATFIANPVVNSWLEKQDIPTDDEIILRRLITREGRSRGYINGRAVSAADLRDIAKNLIEVHSQNAHQSLLEKDTPRQIIDAYAGLKKEAMQVWQSWGQWQKAEKHLKELKDNNEELVAQRQLLEYQVEELRALSPQEGELQSLEEEQKQLANAESTLMSGHTALLACVGDDNNQAAISQLIYQAISSLSQIDDKSEILKESQDLLDQAQVQLDEATNSLQRYLDQIEVNPHRLQLVEERLSDYYSMSRKHQIHPTELFDYWQQQEEAFSTLNLSDSDLEQLEEELNQLKALYVEQAEALSNARQQAAAKLDAEIESHFDSLSLGKAKFKTDFESCPANMHGIDQIQFTVQTNPGSPFGSLAKVASGGELSRISLAIQVVTAASSSTPCLIFDEVDVGIGGGTAERVGRLMRKLGTSTQIMCVTHQPQVAAQAHNHYLVSKVSGETSTHTRIRTLNAEQRSQELARMLGGVEITSQTLAHAEEMLSLAANQ